MAVRVRGRPWPAVLADMIEGIVVVNDLTPPRATRVRTELWEEVMGDERGAEARRAHVA